MPAHVAAFPAIVGDERGRRQERKIGGVCRQHLQARGGREESRDGAATAADRRCGRRPADDYATEHHIRLADHFGRRNRKSIWFMIPCAVGRG